MGSTVAIYYKMAGRNALYGDRAQEFARGKEIQRVQRPPCLAEATGRETHCGSKSTTKAMNRSVISRIQFVWQQSKVQVILVVGLVFVAVLLLVLRPAISACWKATFSDYLDPMIALGTLIVTVGVWYNEQIENWKAQLEKRLHIIYLLRIDDQWHHHVTVVNAPLAGKDDIRNWGQSIGQTIFPQEILEEVKPDPTWARISFTGFKIAMSGKLDKQRKHQYYGLLVFLSAPIKGADDGKVYVFDADGATWAKHDKVPSQYSLEELNSAIPKTNPSTPN